MLRKVLLRSALRNTHAQATSVGGGSSRSGSSKSGLAFSSTIISNEESRRRIIEVIMVVIFSGGDGGTRRGFLAPTTIRLSRSRIVGVGIVSNEGGGGGGRVRRRRRRRDEEGEGVVNETNYFIQEHEHHNTTHPLPSQHNPNEHQPQQQTVSSINAPPSSSSSWWDTALSVVNDLTVTTVKATEAALATAVDTAARTTSNTIALAEKATTKTVEALDGGAQWVVQSTASVIDNAATVVESAANVLVGGQGGVAKNGKSQNGNHSSRSSSDNNETQNEKNSDGCTSPSIQCSLSRRDAFLSNLSDEALDVLITRLSSPSFIITSPPLNTKTTSDSSRHGGGGGSGGGPCENSATTASPAAASSTESHHASFFRHHRHPLITALDVLLLMRVDEQGRREGSESVVRLLLPFLEQSILLHEDNNKKNPISCVDEEEKKEKAGQGRLLESTCVKHIANYLREIVNVEKQHQGQRQHHRSADALLLLLLEAFEVNLITAPNQSFDEAQRKIKEKEEKKEVAMMKQRPNEGSEGQASSSSSSVSTLTNKDDDDGVESLQFLFHTIVMVLFFDLVGRCGVGGHMSGKDTVTKDTSSSSSSSFSPSGALLSMRALLLRVISSFSSSLSLCSSSPSDNHDFDADNDHHHGFEASARVMAHKITAEVRYRRAAHQRHMTPAMDVNGDGGGAKGEGGVGLSPKSEQSGSRRRTDDGALVINPSLRFTLTRLPNSLSEAFRQVNLLLDLAIMRHGGPTLVSAQQQQRQQTLWGDNGHDATPPTSYCSDEADGRATTSSATTRTPISSSTASLPSPSSYSPWQHPRSTFIGQRHIIDTLETHFTAKAAGIIDDRKPTVLLFFGPSGLGKSELARGIARTLHYCNDEDEQQQQQQQHSHPNENDDGKGGDTSGGGGAVRTSPSSSPPPSPPPTFSSLEADGRLVHIHLPSFCTREGIYSLVDPPAAHVGEGMLLSALRREPHAVVVLDEFEKTSSSNGGGGGASAADPIQNLWLSAFQRDGMLRSLKDSSRSTTTRHATFILTCNLCDTFISDESGEYLNQGEDVDYDHRNHHHDSDDGDGKNALLAINSRQRRQEQMRNRYIELCKVAVKAQFGEPFLNRIDFFLPFVPYSDAERRAFITLKLFDYAKRQYEVYNRLLLVTPSFVDALAGGEGGGGGRSTRWESGGTKTTRMPRVRSSDGSVGKGKAAANFHTRFIEEAAQAVMMQLTLTTDATAAAATAPRGRRKAGAVCNSNEKSNSAANVSTGNNDSRSNKNVLVRVGHSTDGINRVSASIADLLKDETTSIDHERAKNRSLKFSFSLQRAQQLLMPLLRLQDQQSEQKNSFSSSPPPSLSSSSFQMLLKGLLETVIENQINAFGDQTEDHSRPVPLPLQKRVRVTIDDRFTAHVVVFEGGHSVGRLNKTLIVSPTQQRPQEEAVGSRNLLGTPPPPPPLTEQQEKATGICFPSSPSSASSPPLTIAAHTDQHDSKNTNDNKRPLLHQHGDDNDNTSSIISSVAESNFSMMCNNGTHSVEMRRREIELEKELEMEKKDVDTTAAAEQKKDPNVSRMPTTSSPPPPQSLLSFEKQLETRFEALLAQTQRHHADQLKAITAEANLLKEKLTEHETNLNRLASKLKWIERVFLLGGAFIVSTVVLTYVLSAVLATVKMAVAGALLLSVATYSTIAFIKKKLFSSSSAFGSSFSASLRKKMSAAASVISFIGNNFSKTPFRWLWRGVGGAPPLRSALLFCVCTIAGILGRVLFFNEERLIRDSSSTPTVMAAVKQR